MQHGDTLDTRHVYMAEDAPGGVYKSFMEAGTTAMNAHGANGKDRAFGETIDKLAERWQTWYHVVADMVP